MEFSLCNELREWQRGHLWLTGLVKVTQPELPGAPGQMISEVRPRG